MINYTRIYILTSKMSKTTHISNDLYDMIDDDLWTNIFTRAQECERMKIGHSYMAQWCSQQWDKYNPTCVFKAFASVSRTTCFCVQQCITYKMVR